MESFTVEYLYSKFLQSDGVSIDTRTLQPDNLFFGISGPNRNGGQFAAEALQKGASFAVIDDPSVEADGKIIKVPNAEVALQELARFHRSRFKRPVIGLTGSNGKTTTKELIRNVLRQKFIVHATEGNYNNHLGVPLTLLHIYPQVEITIIEMGANRLGEIAFLSEMAKPTHGLITNIGHAHTETFGGFDNIIRGKSELFEFLRKTGGKVFVNNNDPVLKNMAKRFNEPDIFPPQDFELVPSEMYLEFSLNDKTHKSQLTGQYNAGNMAAAISVGRYFGVDDEEIASAIESYVPDNMRSQVISRGDMTILLDAYNANPDSMKGALENLEQMTGTRTAILGGMNELDNPEEAHREIGKMINEMHLDQVFLVGDDMKYASEEVPEAVWYSDKEELVSHLEASPLGTGKVLIKGSRTFALETLLENITESS